MAGEIPRNTPPIPGTASAKLPPAPAKTPSRGNFSRPRGGEQLRDLRGHFASGFGINWNGIGRINSDLLGASVGVSAALDVQMENLRKQIQQYAWDNAPWSDDTGRARDGLTAEYQKRPNGESAIILYHTQDYGVFLENDNGGMFAIIIPTLEHFAPQLGAGVFGPRPEARA